MLDFKTINSTDYPLLTEYFSAQEYKLCDYSVGAIFMWKDFFSARYALYEDFLIFQSNYNDREKCFSFPISIKDNSFENIRKAIEILEEHSKSQNIPVINYINVPPEGLAMLETVYGNRMKAESDRDWFDYLYNFNDMLTFEGRKFNGQRNHINKFVRNYPNYSFEPITRDNLDQLIDFYDEYLKDNPGKDEIEQNELIMTKSLILEYFNLPMTGGILKIGDRIAGFSIGEIVNKVLFVHVEKAVLDYKGIYPVIVKEFAGMNADKGILYVNREEDVGNPGLRKSKLSYHPLTLLEKYTAEVII